MFMTIQADHKAFRALTQRRNGAGERLHLEACRNQIAQADIALADIILASAEVCETQANAALLGDKDFLFSPTGQSFICFARKGRVWLALGGPIGLACEAKALCEEFLSRARAARVKPAFYGVSPSFGDLAQDLNLRLLKTGERAILDLPSFTLDGKTRQVIRTHRNRHIKNGCKVEIEGPGAVRLYQDRLREISDQWLSFQPGGEKGFGLGRFEIDYLDRLPLATVRLGDGTIAAFACLWPTANKTRFGVDLMRYASDAPNGVMDYLFAEMFLWAKAEGYQGFDLNTSPAAGVEPCASAPFVTTLAKLAYEHGERFYNFQGVRRFKNKFHPDWEDVFLALPKGRSPISVLAAAAMLINRPKLNR
jgi:lysylphosphatidylglycerol synthetase-like protein (DUF2156 family)